MMIIRTCPWFATTAATESTYPFRVAIGSVRSAVKPGAGDYVVSWPNLSLPGNRAAVIPSKCLHCPSLPVPTLKSKLAFCYQASDAFDSVNYGVLQSVAGYSSLK